MKRKYLSLFSAILSLAVAMTFLTLAAVLLIRSINGKEYVPTSDNGLWVIAVLERLKKAGFNIFFSIMGVVLTSVLAIYRFTLAYFYFKVFKGDDVFYRARLGEIIFFSVLAGIAVAVCTWLTFSGKGVLPVEIQPFILIIFLSYIVLCIIPLLEVAVVYLSKLFEKTIKTSVPTRKGIIDELNELADKTAEEFAQQHVEKEIHVEKPLPIVKAIEEIVVPRVRKVAVYVTPYWDVEDDTLDEFKMQSVTKAGVRKKNRKRRYSTAYLRVRKPISHKKRLKISSPSKIRLRYQKPCNLKGNLNEKRK